MAQLPEQIDLTQVEASTPGGDGRRFPIAWYAAKITGSEIKNSGAGNPRLVFFFAITEGPFLGATIQTGLNIVYPANPKVQAIAHSELKALATSAGYTGGTITDSTVLHGMALDIKIRCQRDNPKFDEVCGFAGVGTKSREEANMAAQSVPPPAQAAAAQVAQVAQPGQVAQAQAQAAPAQAAAQAPPAQAGAAPAWGTPTDQA